MALVVLAIMVIGLMPLLLGSLKLSAINRDTVSATAFANAQMAALRDAFPDSAEVSCATLMARAGGNIADPAGTTLKAEIEVGSCPTDFPDTAVVTVSVRNAAGAPALVALSTQIAVTKP